MFKKCDIFPRTLLACVSDIDLFYFLKEQFENDIGKVQRGCKARATSNRSRQLAADGDNVSTK